MRFRKYEDVKEDILRQSGSAKYFTRKFFREYQAAYNQCLKNFEDLIDDSYFVGNVRLFHSYDPVYASKFYQKNSCGYCTMLEYCHA